MTLKTFSRSPRDIGAAYGAAFIDKIRENLRILVWRDGHPPLPKEDSGFQAWVAGQRSVLEQNWPWLTEEMAGVAAAVGCEFDDVLLLNLRAWQYEYYGKISGCSSVAVTLADGTVACAGALDDPPDLYCGPVHIAPDEGYRFITFPITGTSWGNRSLNSEGLAIGISSQILPGLELQPNTINQDLAVRIILQTCSRVDEVRRFCEAWPFTMNLVCVDADGGIFCAQHTAAGLFELPADSGFAALANHIVDDKLKTTLAGKGVTEFRESDTTRPRRNKLLAFCRENNHKCTAEDVKKLIASDTGHDRINHDNCTVCLTYANPQTEPTTFWTRPGRVSAEHPDFIPLTV